MNAIELSVPGWFNRADFQAWIIQGVKQNKVQAVYTGKEWPLVLFETQDVPPLPVSLKKLLEEALDEAGFVSGLVILTGDK